MLQRVCTIAWFHFKVVVFKVLVVAIFFPIGLVVMPYRAFRGNSDFSEVFKLFNPKHWSECWGTAIECIVGCRWYIVGATRPDDNKLLPYSYYDAGLIFALFLDDVIALNMLLGGNVMSRSHNKNHAKLSRRRRQLW